MMKCVRKTLLLSAAAIAAVAFTAPALAQAEGPFWHVNGEKLETGEAFDLDGELAFKKPISESFTLQIGPCLYGFEGTLENGAEKAEGTFDDFFLSPPCGTNLPGCVLSWAFPELPSSIVANGSGVDILDFLLGVTFTESCKPYGLPSGAAWGGTLAGQWNNETGCLRYENAGELQLLVSEEPIFTDGELCITAPGGAVTLE